jgi:predicted glycoside hydrolase/deacetylase ChbG (UPF0249 family)
MSMKTPPAPIERRLIVNADDFGLSEGVNRGIIEAYQCGIVSSASLMVRWPSSVAAAKSAESTPSLGVGLHVDLGEWYYDDGNWLPRYEVVDVADAGLVRIEVEAQAERFFRLMGLPPTHLDSHQHVHRDPVVRGVLVAIGDRLGVPVRMLTEGVSYCGDFYGQDGRGYPVPDAISATSLIRIIDSLPEGSTELACHAGYGEGLNTTYAHERELEVRALCDPTVRAAVEAAGVELISFASLRRDPAPDDAFTTVHSE